MYKRYLAFFTTVIVAGVLITPNAYGQFFGIPRRLAALIVTGLATVEGNLVVEGTADIAGMHTTTGQMTNSGTGPLILFDETDAVTDERLWRWNVNLGAFSVQTRTDANGAGENAFRILRTGTVVDELEINATLFDVNAAADFSGAVDVVGILDAQATIIDSTGNLTLNDAVDITGKVSLIQEDTPLLPTLNFGDPDSGFYSSGGNNVNLAFAGVRMATLNGLGLVMAVTNSGIMINETGSTTNPIFAGAGDVDSGLSALGDVVNLVAGGVSALSITESGSAISAATMAGVNILPASGSFTPGWTGFSTPPTGDMDFYVVGDIATLIDNSGALGTSNSSLFTMTGIPVAARPAQAMLDVTITRDNGGDVFSRMNISTGGVITFGDGPTTGGYTSSGSKGLPGNWSVVYSIR